MLRSGIASRVRWLGLLGGLALGCGSEPAHSVSSDDGGDAMLGTGGFAGAGGAVSSVGGADAGISVGGVGGVGGAPRDAGVDASDGSDGSDAPDASDADGGAEAGGPECGNRIVEQGEDCDDGNTDDADGCRHDCAFSCALAPDCDDGDPCNGAEICADVAGGKQCQPGTALSPGDQCGSNPRRICDANRVCVDSTCGDGIVDPSVGEQCEPPNTASCSSACHDVLAVVTSASSVGVTEQAAGVKVGVSLDRQPLAPVAVTISSSAGIASVSPSVLNFSTTDWNIPQDITIAAPADDDLAGGVATIDISAPGVTPGTVNVNVTDDDVQAIVEDAPAVLPVTEEGTASFHVHLAYQPAADVMVSVISQNPTLAAIVRPNLVFTSNDWNLDQTVTVSGTPDADLAGGSTSVRLSSAGLTPVDVSVDVADNDVQVIEVNPTSIQVNEGSSTILQVRLAYQPSSSVVVSLASSSPKVTLLPSTLSFTTSDYGTYNSVSVLGAADSDINGEAATITVSTATAPDNVVVPVTVIDTTVVTDYGWPTLFGSSANVLTGQVLAYKFTNPSTTTLDKFGVVATAIGGDYKVALYADSANVPGNLVASLDVRATLASVGNQEVDVVDTTLAAGTYWIAVRAAPSVSLGFSGTSPTATLCARNLSIANLDTAWPTTFGTATCAANGILNLYVVTYR